MINKKDITLLISGFISMFIIYVLGRFLEGMVISMGYEFYFYILPSILYLIISITLNFALRVEMSISKIIASWWMVLIGFSLSYLPTLVFVFGTYLFYFKERN